MASQKLRTPGAGPTSGLLSGVCEMAPFTTRLMPASAKIGIRSMTRSRYGVIGSYFASNNSFEDSHAGPPCSSQASRVPLPS